MNQRFFLVCLVVSTTIGLAACTSGADRGWGWRSAQTTPKPKRPPGGPVEHPTLTGFVIDPAVSMALVCLDIDDDLDCFGEDSVNTDATGRFSFFLEEADVDHRKIAQIIANTSYEVGTGELFTSDFSFMAGPGDGHITALTTYAEFLVNEGQDRSVASQAVIDSFGLNLGVGKLGGFDPTVNSLSDIANRVLSSYIAQISKTALAMNSDLTAASMFATTLNYVHENIVDIVDTVTIVDASVISGVDKDEILRSSLGENIILGDVSIICNENDQSCLDTTGMTGGNGI